ncbi:MAG: lysylphosphatidylglycerol synthase transmembrane domain-containing protein [Candidatus Anstonellales archaeon]
MKKIVLQMLLSLVILALIMYLADFEKVAQIIYEANLFYLAVAVVFYFSINIVMVFRIGMILDYLGEKTDYRRILTSHFGGMLASDFTPARAGYLLTAFLISRNQGVDLNKSLVSILGPQMFDFIFKFVAGGIGIWYLSTFILTFWQGTKLNLIMGLVVLGGMILCIWLLLFSKKFLELISFIRNLPAGKHAYDTLLNMQQNSHAISSLTPQILVLLFVTWVLKAIEWWFISMGLGIEPNINFPPIIFWGFIQPIVTLLQFMPFPTIAGVGLAEGGASILLMQFGVSFPHSVAFTLMTRFVMVMVDIIGIGEVLRLIFRNEKKMSQIKAPKI